MSVQGVRLNHTKRIEMRNKEQGMVKCSGNSVKHHHQGLEKIYNLRLWDDTQSKKFSRPEMKSIWI